jgi:hypothetical protein
VSLRQVTDFLNSSSVGSRHTPTPSAVGVRKPDERVPLVGVVTAIGRPEYDLLSAAGESLRHLADLIASRVPAVRDRRPLEWIVCCDGDPDGPIRTAAVRSIAKPLGLPFRVTSTGRKAGPGSARSCALALVRAPYLLTLDSDDLVVPAGMLASVQALELDTNAAWAASRCHHVRADLQPLWVGPAALARTEAVKACGGWPSGQRARAEDTALWAVLTSRWRGMRVTEHVYNYRRHGASVTHTPGFRALDENLAQIERMVAAGLTSAVTTNVGRVD